MSILLLIIAQFWWVLVEDLIFISLSSMQTVSCGIFSKLFPLQNPFSLKAIIHHYIPICPLVFQSFLFASPSIQPLFMNRLCRLSFVFLFICYPSSLRLSDDNSQSRPFQTEQKYFSRFEKKMTGCTLGVLSGSMFACAS